MKKTCAKESIGPDLKEQQQPRNENTAKGERRSSLVKVTQMKKNAGVLTKKTKEKNPKPAVLGRFSKTSSKVQ